jgi:hypothetical protein
MSKEEVERIRKEFTLQLKSLLDSVIERERTPQNIKIFKQNCSELLTRIQKIKQIYSYMADHLEEIGTVSQSDIGYFFSLAFFYLGVVEITGNYVADFIIAHLLALGHDFHIECTYRTPRIKHVTYLKELEEERVPLATKVNFIEDCGITVFKSIFDVKLRNDIAHMNFEIKDNRVYIRGKPAVEMIESSHKKILAALAVHEKLMTETSTDLDSRMSSLKKDMSNRKPNQ